MLRKTVLATAIVGAGLTSMTGAAFAGDDPGDGGHNWDSGHSHGNHHGSRDHDGSSCSNEVAQANETKGDSFADVLGGAQTAVPLNVCHVLDDNAILNDIDVSVL
ncbi:MAG TPA: hypothetical protein VGH76_22220 [Actinomycetospora sp.]|jgi:hypothetical protein|uniref:hypothetical protein n=1 Tax=Actinomycetospora sp. TaxID=1872135 RepID=UPI002F42B8C6